MATDSHDSKNSHVDQAATDIQAAPDEDKHSAADPSMPAATPAKSPADSTASSKRSDSSRRSDSPPRKIDDPTGIIEQAPVVFPANPAKRAAPPSSGSQRRKFIESSTQLRTAIYDPDATVPEADPVPPHVSRVLQKAEELLASLGPDFSDKTESLRKPAPRPPKRQPTGSVDVAFDDNNHGAQTVPASFEDLPKIDPPSVPELGTDDYIDVDHAIGMTQSIRGPSQDPLRAETATEVADAFEFSEAGRTLPGQGAPSPLSSRPISPGPAAPNRVHGPDSQDEVSSDGMATLSTELPDPMAIGPNGFTRHGPGEQPHGQANPFQPRAALASPPKRSAIRSLFASVKRLFGGAPPPPAPMDDDDEVGYGAGTYTVANRHVAQSRRAGRVRSSRTNLPTPSRPPDTSSED